MRLAEFIRREMTTIVAEWEVFAATLLPAAAGMTRLALRDHAEQILEAVAADLDTPQTRLEQAEKSKGRAPVDTSAPETAAQTHAVLRAQSGFDIKQLVAEYRALRASVLRLWLDRHTLENSTVPEVIRFNEAIDQAIAESVSHFDDQVARARNLLLAVLGHDMRNPLNNMLMTAQYLSVLGAGDKVSEAARRLMRSGAALQELLDELVDYNRVNLGLGLEIVAQEIDLAQRIADEVEQLRGAHPHRRIELTTNGDTRGCWDGRRLQQLLRNLVVNAISYGAPDAPIRISVLGGDDDVTLEVANDGPDIEDALLSHMFDPLRRGGALPDSDSGEGLGLGLYIVKEIVTGHGGEVVVRSTGGETTFSVTLPRSDD